MYLTDREIRSRLSEFAIQADDEHPFEPELQIQPCSIDLRLSPVYWRPRRGLKRTVDLSRSRLLEVSPRRNWIQCQLGQGESITLRPGEMVLGRVFERVTIPADCAGALEGRSSFARMGLSVHSTGGFINPGWSGHMPLSLVNSGSIALRLPAYLPVCQLMLVHLSSAPSRVYGSVTLKSKYIHDDGGPSYWWRDQVIDRLLKELGRSDVAPDLQERLLTRIGVPPDDILERLEVFVATKPSGAFGNVDELLENFVRREERKRMHDQLMRAAAIGSFPLMAAVTISSFFSHPFGFLHYIIWAITLMAAPVSVLGYRNPPGIYLTRRDLEELDRRRREQAA